MARALPWYAQQLCHFLETCGWPQKRCAKALGVSPQALNNWATGRMSVPVRYRHALLDLVAMVMTQALTDAATQPPPALTQCREQCNSAVFRWHFEMQEKRGVSDAWHRELGQQLALAFKSPLSAQGVTAWQAELSLHLEAANMLRRLLRLHDPTSPPTHLEDTYRALDDPVAWFWAMAKAIAREGDQVEQTEAQEPTMTQDGRAE